ncbi:MAG: phosphatase PAP2 family protein [Actinomycetota bacterium]|nr:phosphatase PAP2 family protein [Actinomycetota bacterium]
MVGELVSGLDKLGHYTQQPQTWGGIAVVLAVGGGGRGRRAALRGSASYGLAAVIANFLVKPLIRRRRPSGAGKGKLGPMTSSFPSGHAAADLAFTFGAAQEIPALLVPLVAATLPAHWSLVRSNGHHTTDVLVGGAVGLAVAWGMWKVWPVPHRDDDRSERRTGRVSRERQRHRDELDRGQADRHVLSG